MKGQENKANELAKAFCEKHGFEDKIQTALAQQIKKNIEQVISQNAPTDADIKSSNSPNNMGLEEREFAYKTHD